MSSWYPYSQFTNPLCHYGLLTILYWRHVTILVIIGSNVVLPFTFFKCNVPSKYTSLVWQLKVSLIKWLRYYRQVRASQDKNIKMHFRNGFSNVW